MTIGQSPRTDLVPEMLPWLGASPNIEERGALDGLRDEEIHALRPDDHDPRLVTRLRDGREVLLGKSKLEPRVQNVIDAAEADGTDCVVLLCTGRFGNLTSRGLLLEAQEIVDRGIDTIARTASTVGIMVPLQSQIGELHYRPHDNQALLTSFASPYSADRLEAAARELSPADVTVMHCLGYSETMRSTVAKVSRRPVLLARRLVACAVAQLL